MLNGLEGIFGKIRDKAQEFGKGTALVFLIGAPAIAGAQEIDDNQKYFFVCNSCEDTYKDGSIRSLSQFIGRNKRVFSPNEEIIFVGSDPKWKRGDLVFWTLYNSKGDVVEDSPVTIQYDGQWSFVGTTEGENLMYDIMSSENGGCGSYFLEWDTDKGRELGNSSFSVSYSK